jgi:hypothetical protein
MRRFGSVPGYFGLVAHEGQDGWLGSPEVGTVETASAGLALVAGMAVGQVD